MEKYNGRYSWFGNKLMSEWNLSDAGIGFTPNPLF
jgi:hypothetical protein